VQLGGQTATRAAEPVVVRLDGDTAGAARPAGPPFPRSYGVLVGSAHGGGYKLRKHGLSGLAGRNTAGLALATDLPAAVLSEVTGTSVHNATRWSRFVKRDWADYIVTRRETGLS
jgi:hypothetical protein